MPGEHSERRRRKKREREGGKTTQNGNEKFLWYAALIYINAAGCECGYE